MSVPTYHVVLRVGAGDAFSADTGPDERQVVVTTEGAPGEVAWALDESVWNALAEAGLVPTQAALDFYRLATAAYCADLLVPHHTAFDRWSRAIVLHVPVANRANWTAAEPALRRLLGFLTGDYWVLDFREQAVGPLPDDKRRARWRRSATRFAVSKVSLLSGGLDSAVGAYDLLTAGEDVAFVSHNAKSGGAIFSSPAQHAVLDVLRPAFTGPRFSHLRFRLNPPSPVAGVTERVTTTRSRSIIFFGLALLAASALDAAQGTGPVPLVVPENGLISLNVPLTRARYGSWSTRTTHPHTLAMLREVLAGLGIPTPIETPYAAMTKGEMLARVVARDAVRSIALTAATVSCAHPNQSRFLDAARRKPHCGTCVPCIIRRAATQHAGIDDGQYSFDLPRELGALRPTRASDARAFIYALERRHRPSRPLDINVSGPLHTGSEAELRTLVRVYEAGMDEVAQHLGVG
jgi:hypothetical protein